MSTVILEEPVASGSLKKFVPTDSAIEEMREKYLPLAIIGIDDTEGFKAVHSARMVVKSHRVAVEKVRKELKADSIEYGRRVDAEAKRITEMLDPIEEHLAAEEKVVNDEKERIRNEARLKAEAEALAAKEAEEARQKAIKDAEDARIKAEQDAENERLRIERDKLAEQQRVIDEQRKQLEAEKAKAAEEAAAIQRAKDAEAKRIADIEAARLREIENERIRKEAAEKARIETEQRIAREAAEAKARKVREEQAAKEKADRAEKKRLRALALRPDREKLLEVAEQIESIVVPDDCELTDIASPTAAKLRLLRQEMATTARQIVNELE